MMIQMVQIFCWETTQKLKVRVRVAYILTMVPSIMYCMIQVMLSVYQMTHTGSPTKFVFNPNDVEIYDIVNGRVIAKGFVDHSSRVCRFSHFMPFSNPSALLMHANEASKIWHERFGHLNYKYILYLCENTWFQGFQI